jgi:hypothetical protein
MSSLGFLIESLRKKDFQNKDKQEKIKEIISFGKNIREDFWDDFILLLNNSEGLAALLNVPEDIVSTWHHEIKKNLKDKDSEIEIYKKKRKMLRN